MTEQYIPSEEDKKTIERILKDIEDRLSQLPPQAVERLPEPVAYMYLNTNMGNQLMFQCFKHYWPKPHGKEHEYIQPIPLVRQDAMAARVAELEAECGRLRKACEREFADVEMLSDKVTVLKAQLAKANEKVDALRAELDECWGLEYISHGHASAIGGFDFEAEVAAYVANRGGQS